MAKLTITQEYDPAKLNDSAYVYLLCEHMKVLVELEIRKAMDGEISPEPKVKCFEDIALQPADVIQHLLRNISKNKLVLAMKGASRDFLKVVEQNLSEQSFKLLAMDMNAAYMIKIREIDEAQQEMLKIVNDYYSSIESV